MQMSNMDTQNRIPTKVGKLSETCAANFCLQSQQIFLILILIELHLPPQTNCYSENRAAGQTEARSEVTIATAKKQIFLRAILGSYFDLLLIVTHSN